MTIDSDTRVREIKARAHGRWTSLLRALGVDDRILNGKNQPCPLPGCGGTDRFQYTDKFGEGNYICRACGAGGGLKLAQGVLGLKFPEVLARLERELCFPPTQPPRQPRHATSRRMRELCERIWTQSRPVQVGDEVDRYLRGRGIALASYPDTVRMHPALGYYEREPGQARSIKVGEYSAMVALVQAPDGEPITLHRTYLKDGRKAFGAQSKKVLSAGYDGGAVRLDAATRELAVTEGIETALAVRLSTGKPVWAALNCGNLEKLQIPRGVELVLIYADNDSDAEFAGQVSAYHLAQRLMREAHRSGRTLAVRVHVPRQDGADWADVWFASLALDKAPA